MTERRFSSIGIDRLRMATDGCGITTLVCGTGCPLDCRWCLNPQCKPKNWDRTRAFPSYTVEELYRIVAPDSLYFEATGGGITFGGGEPLLQAEFLRDFIRFTREKGRLWRFAAETCLNVPRENLTSVLDLLDEWIVDVKDMNPAVYRAYTGCELTRMRENLSLLAERCPEKTTLRLPLIPEFNTEEDAAHSEEILRSMGFVRFDRFQYVIREKK